MYIKLYSSNLINLHFYLDTQNVQKIIGTIIYIYINHKNCFYVLYAFLNRSSDCDEIWYRDRLDLGEDRPHFVVKK